MALLKRILIVLSISFAIIYAVSLFKPATWTVKRSIEINASPEKIFPYIHDLHNWSQWHPWSNKSLDVSMTVSFSGPREGVGSVRQWSGANMKSGKIEITQAEKNRFVEYSFSSESTDVVIHGKLTIRTLEKGCIVEWEDSGNLGDNMFARLFSGGIDSVVGGKFEEGLKKLKEAVEKS